MERHKIIELMGQLKLAGMRAACDEVTTAGLRARRVAELDFAADPGDSGRKCGFDQ